MVTSVQQAQPRSWQRTLKGYVALMKLRVVELLLVTTVPTMIVAQQGWPSLGLVVATLVGGTLAAGGANAITTTDGASNANANEGKIHRMIGKICGATCDLGSDTD